MKINHPSISTNRAISWYHHYLTLATHSRCLKETMRSVIDWRGIHNTIRSQDKSCKSCQNKRHSQKYGITLMLSWS